MFILLKKILLTGGLCTLIFNVHSKPCDLVQLQTETDHCEDPLAEFEKLKDIVCPFPDLRSAMNNERMAQIIAGNNSFQTLATNDVIRLQRGMGGIVVFNPLKKKITQTYKRFNQITKSEYTLNLTVYPAKVDHNTCKEHRTITKTSINNTWLETLRTVLLDEEILENTTDTLGVQREIDGIFGSYVPVKDRKPLHFELRQDSKGRAFICENPQIPNRIEFYCGEDQECIQQMPPLCSSVDTKNKQKNACVSLDTLKDTTIGTLKKSQKMMKSFCPSGCSYYVQTLQTIKQLTGDQYCIENYAIVHCGPQKKQLTYNLNVKVIDDFCEDFNVHCLPQSFPQTAKNISQ